MVSQQLILVGGGTRSGKSSFSLALARRLGTRRLFVATGQPGDDEMQQRIAHHRRTRGNDFHTLEEPLAVAGAISRVGPYDVVVLDCLTLWLANLLLEGKGPDTVQQHVEELVAVLRKHAKHAVIVTNEVGMGIVPETPLGRLFRDVAGSAHQHLSRAADEVYLAVLGTVLRIKPTLAFAGVGEELA